MALAAYRQLLRAARVAFEGESLAPGFEPHPGAQAILANLVLCTGDTRVLTAARQQIRQGFRDKAALSPSDPGAEAAVKEAEELATFLRTNVVQGRKAEHEDTYRA